MFLLIVPANYSITFLILSVVSSIDYSLVKWGQSALPNNYQNELNLFSLNRQTIIIKKEILKKFHGNLKRN